MEIVNVKPAPGARVRQPERNNRVMPGEGDRVPRNTYYERLIISGDLIVQGAEPADREQSPRHRPRRGEHAPRSTEHQQES